MDSQQLTVVNYPPFSQELFFFCHLVNVGNHGWKYRVHEREAKGDRDDEREIVDRGRNREEEKESREGERRRETSEVKEQGRGKEEERKGKGEEREKETERG